MEERDQNYCYGEKIYMSNDDSINDDELEDDDYASQDELDYINDIMFPNDDDDENQTYDSIFGDD